jgi:hypothetical protein
MQFFVIYSISYIWLALNINKKGDIETNSLCHLSIHALSECFAKIAREKRRK